ncbi:HlyD family secretion protein [Scandinavium sp. V105_16]|uniref:HlyD family secretion protein n=1 Tax=Scandinavium lactucae TaxID=3095028 RepID=A0AAJ2RXZ2_9ENTR|nr:MULTISPECIES: HlyD family secretion protein [unclassified Scandinavium]MDX6018814.1 HlyD family secretion protein [Scandinavium sp. V105_16]MDX6030225.1 HlyD family secretion protein [Scandinavium sp. V105_12]MDX6039109.1 HlyD family secretion protein [Scandinavium sp. V105_6]MDX6050180.1 HlyD family secretion protein [Scandinavium sp. V105_1]
MNIKKLRFILLLVVPTLGVAAGGWVYFTGGRYVETDNAYVKADKTAIGAEVSGRVLQVAVKENQHVNKGDLLFSIDPKPYELAVAQATSDLNNTVIDLKTIKSQYQSKLANIAVSKSQLAYAQREEGRLHRLNGPGYVSASDLDGAHQKSLLMALEVNMLQKQLQEVADSFGGDISLPVEKHPRYKKALAELNTAKNNLSHVNEYAPSSGNITKVLQRGEYVQSGTTAMLLVSDHNLYIEANFTEKDLTHIRDNEPAEINVDYAPGVTWHGKVSSISPATGAEYSVIPAENATGNWVKVTQRVPVRIRLQTDANQPQLRAGLSATIKIDTQADARSAS